MADDDLVSALTEFGAPFYVPASGDWKVAAVERTADRADAALVFASRGEIEIRTEAIERRAQPLSIQVANVQAATVNGGPVPGRVTVEDAQRTVMIDSLNRTVRLLYSHSTFHFEVELNGRRIAVGGPLEAFDHLALIRCDRPVTHS